MISDRGSQLAFGAALATIFIKKGLMAKIDAFFNLMFEQKASDLHMTAGNPPMLRINGELERVDYPPLENDSLKTMLYEIARITKSNNSKNWATWILATRFPTFRGSASTFSSRKMASARCSGKFQSRALV